MASLGSEAKSLGNGCDLLASGWLELQACSESGQKCGGCTREGRAQPQLAEAGGDVTQAPCSICRSFWGPQPSGVTFGVVLLLAPARCPRRGTAHGTALLCPSGKRNQSFVGFRVQAAAPKDTAGLKANPARLPQPYHQPCTPHPLHIALAVLGLVPGAGVSWGWGLGTPPLFPPPYRGYKLLQQGAKLGVVAPCELFSSAQDRRGWEENPKFPEVAPARTAQAGFGVGDGTGATAAHRSRAMGWS